MTLGAFIGLFIFTFILAYAVLVIFNGIREIFPQERGSGLRVDFRNYD